MQGVRAWFFRKGDQSCRSGAQGRCSSRATSSFAPGRSLLSLCLAVSLWLRGRCFASAPMFYSFLSRCAWVSVYRAPHPSTLFLSFYLFFLKNIKNKNDSCKNQTASGATETGRQGCVLAKKKKKIDKKKSTGWGRLRACLLACLPACLCVSPPAGPGLAARRPAAEYLCYILKNLNK